MKSADKEALAEAIRAAGEADPLLVDATGLVLEVHRDFVQALGITGRGEQTRWLIGVQAALLAQLEARPRRAREHALVWARCRGFQVEWPLELLMRRSHRLRLWRPTAASRGAGCAACGPQHKGCGGVVPAWWT